MSTYEIVFILNSKKIEDGGETFARDVAKHVKSLGGRLQQRTSLGRKQFARPIGKHRAGVYWDFVVDLGPDTLVAFREKYALNPAVLRLQMMHHQEHAPIEPRTRAQRD